MQLPFLFIIGNSWAVSVSCKNFFCRVTFGMAKSFILMSTQLTGKVGEAMKKVSEWKKLEKIYELYEQKMYYLAFAILKDEGFAEDAVHEAMLGMTSYLPAMEDTASPGCYSLIKRLTKNAAIDIYRRRRRENIICVQFDEEPEGAGSLTELGNPERCIEVLYSKELLKQCMKDMPDSLKELLKLKYMCELDNQEVSELLGISAASVRKRDERLKKFILNKVGETYEQ